MTSKRNSTEKNGDKKPRYSSHGKHQSNTPPNRDPKKATIAEIKDRLGNLLILDTKEARNGNVYASCPNFDHGDENPRPFYFGSNHYGVWLKCKGDCSSDELWQSLNYDPPDKHGGKREGAGRKPERIVCGIDHADPNFDAVTLRETEAARRIQELDSFAYINKAFHVRTGNLWTRLDRTNVEKLYHDLGKRELDLCYSCRRGGYASVYSQAFIHPIEIEHRGLLLVKTTDHGFKVIDVNDKYQVRDPAPSDYLTCDQFLDLDLTLAEIEDPKLDAPFPLYEMLTGDELGQWQWDNDAYNFLVAILARGLFRVSEGRTAYLIAPSGAGKGTIVDTCLLAFGTYAVKLRAKEFVQSQFEASNLEGKSLAVFDEHISGPLISKLNAFTEGKIRIERKYMEACDIHFGGLPLMADTKLPSMFRFDGAERRSAIFENQHTIERGLGKDDGGTRKLEIVTQSAKPLLIDCLHHAKHGINDLLIPPQSVLQSTRREWTNSDEVNAWIEEHIEAKDGGHVRFADVRKRIETDLKLTRNTRSYMRIERAFVDAGYMISGGKQGKRIRGAFSDVMHENL